MPGSELRIGDGDTGGEVSGQRADLPGGAEPAVHAVRVQRHGVRGGVHFDRDVRGWQLLRKQRVQAEEGERRGVHYG
jgi:hypothetical protein